MTTPSIHERANTASWLRKLRDQYSDEIPAVMVHSNSPNPAYKVRGGWWLVLDLVLEHAASEHVFSPEFARKIKRFADSITREDFSARRRTASDVAMGNQMIDEALHELEDHERGAKGQPD
jgi:hypothetical protein